MLEPTIIRQTGILTEWHGTHGAATADNGEVYALTLANMQRDLFGRIPAQGSRVELYLHQNERGKTEFVECCVMPSFNYQGGYELNNTIYAQTEGRPFYTDIGKIKRDYAVNMAWFALILVILSVISARRGTLVDHAFLLLVITGKIIFDGLCWRKKVRKPQSYDTWQFTLNQQGIAFSLHIPREGNLANWRNWTDIKKISLEKSIFLQHPYWRIECHLPKLRTHKIYLHQLSEDERKIAQEMMMQYFQAA